MLRRAPNLTAGPVSRNSSPPLLAARKLSSAARTRLADEGAGMIAIGMPRHQLHLVHRSVVFVALATFATSVISSAPVRALSECRKGDFEKIAVVGHGMTSFVFLARHIRTRQVFAIKRIPKSWMQTPTAIANEPQMLRLMQGISFVVKLYCSMSDSSYEYLVMEFCQGGELYELVLYDGPLQERHAKFYAASIVLALEQMHERGIIYRDLKLQNVLLTTTGQVRLTDAGFSKRLAAGARTRSFLGTPEYMAPEIYKGKDYDHSVDWWSLGVVIYQMLFKKVPFEFRDGDFPTQWERIFSRSLDISSDVLSVAVQNIIRGLLCQSPESRLGSRGAHEVKNHEWFSDIDWDALAQERVPPPFIADFTGDTDLSLFDMDWVQRNVNTTPEFEDF